MSACKTCGPKTLTHPQLVKSLIKPPVELLADLTPDRAHWLHMAVGISGEAGELLDAVKKCAVYAKPLDVDNVIEELGDLEFYMEGMRQALGLSRDLILRRNVEKLSTRYGSHFSNIAAQERKDKQ